MKIGDIMTIQKERHFARKDFIKQSILTVILIALALNIQSALALDSKKDSCGTKKGIGTKEKCTFTRAVAVISDTHCVSNPKNDYNKKFREKLRKLNAYQLSTSKAKIPISLIVNNGDLVETIRNEDLSPDSTEPFIEEYKAMTDSSTIEVVSVLGNHDFLFHKYLEKGKGNVTVNGVNHGLYVYNSNKEPQILQKWKNIAQIPARTTRIVGGYKLIFMTNYECVYNAPARQVYTAQDLEFLETELRSSHQCFLFTHIPLYSKELFDSWVIPFNNAVTSDIDDYHMIMPTDKIYTILRKYSSQIEACFFGHVHHFSQGKLQESNITYYTTDSSCKNDNKFLSLLIDEKNKKWKVEQITIAEPNSQLRAL